MEVISFNDSSSRVIVRLNINKEIEPLHNSLRFSDSRGDVYYFKKEEFYLDHSGS